MKLRTFRQTFDGRDVLTLEIGRQKKTGKRRLPVEQHRAGAALPDFTAVFGSGQCEILPQHFKQRTARICGKLPHLAIYHQTVELF
jgi:hypothetical protein